MAFSAPVKRNSDIGHCAAPRRSPRCFLAMGRELSGGVLKEFDPEEIRIVTRAAAELKPISTPELESIIEEFAQNFSAGPNILGNVGELEKLLNGVLPPEQISDIISEVLGNKTKSVWDRISHRLRKPAGKLSAQGASADGRFGALKGQAGMCRKGHESPAVRYPA